MTSTGSPSPLPAANRARSPAKPQSASVSDAGSDGETPSSGSDDSDDSESEDEKENKNNGTNGIAIKEEIPSRPAFTSMESADNIVCM